ncbi:MAG: hypothetical protein DI536_25395 [Archangium gephyra]|uniref:Uncharacterized protein n=1 Tax=Archangium gephyra TaxID=48 RepID=A0A2W5UXX2_9BACT|nr:MAG: hypothetical protein DI536_25395 [Archangium gephyra]
MPPPSASGPSQGAAETTLAGKKPGYAEIQSMVDDALSKNDEYIDLSANITRAIDLGKDVQTCLSDYGVGMDRTLTEGEIRDLAKIGSTPAIRAAAQRLIDNHGLLAKFLNGNDAMTMSDVSRVCDEMKTRQGEIRKSTERQIRSDIDAKPLTGSSGDPSTGTSPNTGTPGNDGTTPEPPSTETPKPPPSTRPGTEGALENLANGQEWIQKEIERLANEAAKDPAKAPALQARISMLQNQFQVLANMSTQINQMMSNITKMWSDIAMNSVRNIK